MSERESQSASNPPGAERFWEQFGAGESGRRGGAAAEEAGTPGRGEPTGNGHEQAREPRHGAGNECLEWCPICRTAEVLRASAPPELRGQVANLQRDALVTMRALLDAYIERLGENGPSRGRGVEDIPID